MNRGRFHFVDCIRLLSITLILCFAAAHGQTSSADRRTSDDLITGLLKLPAPPPPAGIPGAQLPQDNSYRAPEFSIPTDDAPSDVLGRYWAQKSGSDESRPSANVQRRLLEFCETKPELLPSLLTLLPQDHESSGRIKLVYDKNGVRFGDDWKNKVRKYLELHSDFFRDDLVADARAAKDDDEGGYVEHSEDLEGLAAIDWSRAEVILKMLAAGKAPRTALIARVLIYRHALSNGDQKSAATLRSELQAVVADRKALGYCRDRAAEALLETEWAGRDEWYLTLFHDPSLRDIHDGMYLREPLTTLVDRDPDHWIPIMTQMVSDSDRVAHDAAVSCLIRFNLASARKDALTPLLPWLMDPHWSSARDRLRLIQSVDRLDMKESIAGLIAVLTEKGDSYDRSYAAESLAHFKDPRAVPALRVALENEQEADHRRRIISGLIACGGVSPAEAADAVEAYARFTLTPEGKQKWEASEYSYGKIEVPAQVALGAYITRKGPERDDAVELLAKRTEELKSQDTTLASYLQSLIAEWPSRVADRATVRRVLDGSVTPDALASALQRRDSLQKTVATELRDAEGHAGIASGSAAILLADQGKEFEILNNKNDADAQKALLASARLVREKLPLGAVQELRTSDDTVLLDAIDAYLEADDRLEARKLYLERHKGEARIVGARQSFDPGHHSFRDFNNLEDQLRDEIKTSSERTQIVALLSAGYWGNAGQIIVRADATGAEIRFVEDTSRYYTRKLTNDEWNQLQLFIRDNHVEELGPLNLAAWDGMQYEYVHVNQDGGRRVFMNNPGAGGSGGSAYDRLCKEFWDLLGTSHLDLHYRMADKIPGFEVLVADNRFFALRPWKQGTDLRLTVYPNERSGGAFANNGAWHIEGETLLPKEPTWVALRDSGLNVVDPPGYFPKDDPDGVVPAKIETERKERGNNSEVWPLTQGGRTYRLAELNDKSGLWQFTKGREPKLIIEGEFLWPVITPDGKWALLAGCKDTWAQPNFVIRVDLGTGKSFRLDIPDADKIKPLTYVSARGAVLVVRYQETAHSDGRKPVGPESPEFWLVDAPTGKGEIAHGEFSPLEDIGARPLQDTNSPGRSWAAIYLNADAATAIGLYSAADFSFTTLLRIPGLAFSSDQMWVDNSERKIYISYRGQLLRINMPEMAR
jgi:hypothetical protein